MLDTDLEKGKLSWFLHLTNFDGVVGGGGGWHIVIKSKDSGIRLSELISWLPYLLFGLAQVS